MRFLPAYILTAALISVAGEARAENDVKDIYKQLTQRPWAEDAQDLRSIVPGTRDAVQGRPLQDRIRTLWNRGEKSAAVEEILKSEEFRRSTLATFASRITNEEGRAFERPDLDQRAWISAFDSGTDVRLLFSRTIAFDGERLNLDTAPATPSQVGLLSTPGFARRFIAGGTNRRPVRAAFKLFLCSDIEEWKDRTLPDMFVGRDIDRAPGGEHAKYQQNCRACHAPMDSLRGAWANYDATEPDGRLLFSSAVQQKNNRNSDIYPSGFWMMDSQWTNFLTTDFHQNVFGWRGPTSGSDLRSMGRMIAESGRFQRCMAQRVSEVICPAVEKFEPAVLDRWAGRFRENNYDLRSLFLDVAMSGECRSGAPHLKNGREYYYSLAQALNMAARPDFQEIVTAFPGLPERGELRELVSSYDIYLRLGANLCESHARGATASPLPADESLIRAYWQAFLGRAPDAEEAASVAARVGSLKTTEKVFSLCLLMSVHPQFLISGGTSK